MTQKVPKELGGVPTPLVEDEDKALIADGAGGYYWGNQVASVPNVEAVDVSFDNTVGIPNNPTESQAAIEEVYKRIPASKVVKLCSNSGGHSATSEGVAFIREDGLGFRMGDNYFHTFADNAIWKQSWGFKDGTESFDRPMPFPIFEFGTKVHDISLGYHGLMIVTGTEDKPRSKILVSGAYQGTPAFVSDLTQVYEADDNSVGKRVKKIWSMNFSSIYVSSGYLLENGELYLTGSRANYQLGNGEAINNAYRTDYARADFGVLGVVGQKVTNFVTTSLNAYAEVTTDDNVYKLCAWGYNHIGQLGLGFVNSKAGSGDGNNSVKTPTYCRSPTDSGGGAHPDGGFIVSSVGGPFKKILATMNTAYTTCVAVLSANGDLYYAGNSLGGGSDTSQFIKIDSNVADFAMCGGSTGSVIWCKVDGSVKGGGYNVYGCLGTGNDTDIPLTTATTIYPAGGINGSPVVECFGPFGSPSSQFVLRTANGRVYTAGNNVIGTGLIAANSNVFIPVKLMEPIREKGIYMCLGGLFSVYYIGESGTLYAAGNNDRAQLGYSPNEFTTALTPVPVRTDPGHWISGRWDFLNT